MVLKKRIMDFATGRGKPVGLSESIAVVTQFWFEFGGREAYTIFCYKKEQFLRLREYLYLNSRHPWLVNKKKEGNCVHIDVWLGNNRSKYSHYMNGTHILCINIFMF